LKKFRIQKNQRILQAHCQSPTSQCTNQSFVKELAKPTQDKIVFKKFNASKKNKKRNTQPTLNDTTTQQRQWFENTVDKYHWL
jgi:hypothetical protein